MSTQPGYSNRFCAGSLGHFVKNDLINILEKVTVHSFIYIWGRLPEMRVERISSHSGLEHLQSYLGYLTECRVVDLVGSGSFSPDPENFHPDPDRTLAM